MRILIGACVGGLLAYLALRAVGVWQDAGKDLTDLPPLKILRRRYFFWEAAGTVAMFAAIGIAWGLLVLVGNWRYQDTADVLYLAPPPLLWLFPAFFIGIVTSVLPIDAALRWSLGPRYPEFEAYQIIKFGYDSRPLRAPIYSVLALASALVVAALLDWHVRFGPTDIEIAELWNRDTYHFTYDEVLEIRYAEQRIRDNGKVAGPTFSIHFAEGQRWHVGPGSPPASAARLRQLADYVSQQSGLPIYELERASDTTP